jgi:hypothetical protein
MSSFLEIFIRNVTSSNGGRIARYYDWNFPCIPAEYQESKPTFK